MKPPAFVAAAAGAARSVGAKLASLAGRLAEAAKDAAARISGSVAGLMSKATAGNRRSATGLGVGLEDGLQVGDADEGVRADSSARRRIATIAAIAAAVLGLSIVFMVAISANGRRGAGKTEASPPAEAPTKRVAGAAAGTVDGSITGSWPSSGPGLASAMLIPGRGEWPWPLAFEPKSRYTDAEAAALRPDLGEIDTTELTRRRKAALEAMYGSVD